MKTKTLVSLIALLGLLGGIATADPMGTAFTYQGRLDDGGKPANGIYDLRFGLYDAATLGTEVGTITNTATAVSNGLFTVTLDFGSLFFNGYARWLGIGVLTNGALTEFAMLSPRQPLTPVPYALFASNAVSAAVVVNNGVANAALQTGAVTSDKVADGTLQPADLNVAGFNTTFWRVSGNAGTTPGTHFLGTTDNQHLELKVNSLRALRLESTGDGNDEDGIPNGSPNVVGGSSGNFVAAGTVGATIAGGGATSFYGKPYPNSVWSDYGTVSGGFSNRVLTGAWDGVIGGGFSNTLETNAYGSTIAGGERNSVGQFSGWNAIGGGYSNNIAPNSLSATIPGGYNNFATNYAFAAGRRAKAKHSGAFVWADSQDADFSSTANDTFIVRAAGGVGINKSSPSADLHVGGSVKIDDFFAVTRTTLAPTAGSTITPTSGYIALSPSSAVTLSATTAITGTGRNLGDILILEGRSDVNTVTVPDNANTKLAASRTLGINDTLILMWNSGDWIELSFTSNGP